MCRYSDNSYSCHYVCFSCKKSFKAFSAWAKTQINHNESRKCPECGKEAADLGQDFKPPRREAKSQWKKVELLFKKGYDFHSCGCRGPGYRPKTYSEAKQIEAL